MKERNILSGQKTIGCLSRRRFLSIAGTVAVGMSLGACARKAKETSRFLDIAKLPPDALPAEGYLLVDTKNCQGCVSCMMACSLAHHGKMNLSLSRIQIMQNSFVAYPDDIGIAQCRQCLEPECVAACPEDALHIDTDNGNIRRVDIDACIGCKSCLEACPYAPARAIWNAAGEHAQKCDLCMDTPHWDEDGGIGGKQACVAVCPVGAITFTHRIPVQQGDRGYHAYLRGKPWASMGYPID